MTLDPRRSAPLFGTLSALLAVILVGFVPCWTTDVRPSVGKWFLKIGSWDLFGPHPDTLWNAMLFLPDEIESMDGLSLVAAHRIDIIILTGVFAVGYALGRLAYLLAFEEDQPPLPANEASSATSAAEPGRASLNQRKRQTADKGSTAASITTRTS